MEKKYYQVGTHNNDQWNQLHDELTLSTSNLTNIPDRECDCCDEKEHSPTRGVFLLTDDEANALKNDERVKFVCIDYASYPELYAPPPDEIVATPPELIERYSGAIKNYREFQNSRTLPSNPNETDVNRAGYQLLRCMQKDEPWLIAGFADSTVYNANIKQFGTGKDVDVIVADDGAGWIGHPEFQNNCIDSPAPAGYTGGNVLPGNGTCDVLDIFLDGPYYLDPDYFNADPGNRLQTRWDGTTVPVDSFAVNWWKSTSNRSSTFNTNHPSAGTVNVVGYGTRNYCNGSNTVNATVGKHCTPCMGLSYGRTRGWAYNANKWVHNLFGSQGTGIEKGFDIQKIFHNTKPVNSVYGNKNPTVISNSWGYRSNKRPSTGQTYYYTFRSDYKRIPFTSSNVPEFIDHLGVTGDGGRFKSEMTTNGMTTALDELIDAGVIFVAASGNSNQKQVNWDHPDFNNYIAKTNTHTLEQSSLTAANFPEDFEEIFVPTTGTTNRRGFPQQGGKTTDPVTGEVTYKTINIGALDDDFYPTVPKKERKVSYSDRGEGILVYFPADGTLAPNNRYTPEGGGPYPAVYPGFTANSGSGVGVPEEVGFGGTSAACPVAAGFIATLMERNRNWTYLDVQNYFASLDEQDKSVFFHGTESAYPDHISWRNYEGLEGGRATVGYQVGTTLTTPPTGEPIPPTPDNPPGNQQSLSGASNLFIDNKLKMRNILIR